VRYAELTAAEWRDARKRALTRAFQLTRSKPKAADLVDTAIAAALEPTREPWDPARHTTFVAYLCDLVWSLHGTEIASYRVKLASERLEDAENECQPDSTRPEALLIDSRDARRAERCHAELRRRVAGDPLIVLLLDAAADGDGGEPDDPEGSPAASTREGREMAADEPQAEHVARPNAEPASTRRALAKGYSLKDIKNARERLKRHALAVAQDDEEAEP
jgi:hypothetical protein